VKADHQGLLRAGHDDQWLKVVESGRRCLVKGGVYGRDSAASASDRSSIRIARLKGGYTWNVFVVTDDNGQAAVQQAKQQAVEIVRELERELTPSQVRRRRSLLARPSFRRPRLQRRGGFVAGQAKWRNGGKRTKGSIS
jgi:hypothetical protein